MSSATQFSFMRYEKKYILDHNQYNELFHNIENHVEIDEYGEHTILNIYYDTDDYTLVRESIEKPVFKEKLRMRSYGIPEDGDNVFVELKKKYDGVVYKRRVQLPLCEARKYLECKKRPQISGQILDEIDWFVHMYDLKPKTFIGYERTAVFAKDDPALRITFDQNIRWRGTDLDLALGDCGFPILSGDQILMEIKIPGAMPLWLSHCLSELDIFSASFSKVGDCYKRNLIFEPTKSEVVSCA